MKEIERPSENLEKYPLIHQKSEGPKIIDRYNQ